MKVLLSIKPEFTRLIFGGTKKYEYRKVIFNCSGVKRVVVYASHPIKKIIGEIEIEEIIYDEPQSLWEKTEQHSGVSEEFFFSYFSGRERGYAIKIKTADLYEEPVDPYAAMENFTAPQSFMYLRGQSMDGGVSTRTIEQMSFLH